MFFSQTLAALCAFLASAPFTPAVVAVTITLPLGFVGWVTGRRRTGFLAIYWSLCSLVAFLTLGYPSRAGDSLLLAFFVLGVALSVALLISLY